MLLVIVIFLSMGLWVFQNVCQNCIYQSVDRLREIPLHHFVSGPAAFLCNNTNMENDICHHWNKKGGGGRVDQVEGSRLKLRHCCLRTKPSLDE